MLLGNRLTPIFATIAHNKGNIATFPILKRYTKWVSKILMTHRIICSEKERNIAMVRENETMFMFGKRSALLYL